jgi:hypothetical protein
VPAGVAGGARRVWRALCDLGGDVLEVVRADPRRPVPVEVWSAIEVSAATRGRYQSAWRTFVQLVLEPSSEEARACVDRWRLRTLDLERALRDGSERSRQLAQGEAASVSALAVWPAETLIEYLVRVWQPSVTRSIPRAALAVDEVVQGVRQRRAWLTVVLRLWTLARSADVVRMRWSSVRLLEQRETAVRILAGDTWASVLSRTAFVLVSVVSGKGARMRYLWLPVLRGELRALCVAHALADWMDWWGVGPAVFAAHSGAEASADPFLLFAAPSSTGDWSGRARWPWRTDAVLALAGAALSPDTSSHDVLSVLQAAEVAGRATRNYPALASSMRSAVLSWLRASGVDEQAALKWGGWASRAVMRRHYACARSSSSSAVAREALQQVLQVLLQPGRMRGGK